MVPIVDLVPYACNARTHSEAHVAQIAASIKEFGFTNPILTDGKNGVIAGHGRLRAAQSLGMAEVPTVELSHLSKAQKQAYILAGNQLALNAGWDTELLKSELSDLNALNFDISLIGFDAKDLSDLLRVQSGGLTDADDLPDIQQEVVSDSGDVWILGNHRLICGDATDTEAVARACDGVKPNLMVTDPPYGVNYDPAWRNQAAKDGHLAYADRRVGKVQKDDRADWSAAWALFPGDVIYSWHPPGALSLVHGKALQDSGFDVRAQIIWAKSHFPIGRGDYHLRHEPCWYAVRKGKAARRTKDRTQTTLWEINLDKNVEGGHSTQKPVECMARAIRNHEISEVYDPFVGSGTTIIACEMLRRKCFAIELDPHYADVCVRRWQRFTGKEVFLESDGRTFQEKEGQASIRTNG